MKIGEIVPSKHKKFVYNGKEYRVGHWEEFGDILCTYFTDENGQTVCCDWDIFYLDTENIEVEVIEE